MKKALKKKQEEIKDVKYSSSENEDEGSKDDAHSQFKKKKKTIRSRRNQKVP